MSLSWKGSWSSHLLGLCIDAQPAKSSSSSSPGRLFFFKDLFLIFAPVKTIQSVNFEHVESWLLPVGYFVFFISWLGGPPSLHLLLLAFNYYAPHSSSIKYGIVSIRRWMKSLLFFAAPLHDAAWKDALLLFGSENNLITEDFSQGIVGEGAAEVGQI